MCSFLIVSDIVPFKLNRTWVFHFFFNWNTVKPVYNDHSWDPKIVAVVDRWSLCRGSFMMWQVNLGPQNSGRCGQVGIIRRWSLTQVWLYIKIENGAPVFRSLFDLVFAYKRFTRKFRSKEHETYLNFHMSPYGV